MRRMESEWLCVLKQVEWRYKLARLVPLTQCCCCVVSSDCMQCVRGQWQQ